MDSQAGAASRHRGDAVIDSHTQLVGVLGYPVRHSLSPPMHNRAFAHLGLNWVYLAFEVLPESLSDAIAGMRGLGIRGLNLTIPHKEAVCALVDRLSSTAQAIGAVNTLYWDGNQLVGDNTDSEGFLRALAQEGVQPDGMRVLVVGAGGSARAIVHALQSRGCEVLLANRTPERAHQLAQAFGIETVVPLCAESLKAVLPGVQGVVNCTSLGMNPHSDTTPDVPLEHLPRSAWVCDLVYRPLQTRFLRTAQALGLKPVGGLGMLVH
ncbi:MAG: shikimate dehydrogenase, partial [Fimbriimonadales bacterium]